MSDLPTMVNPLISNDQQVQDFFRLAGQQANADGSGFIFVNGTFQLLSADEFSRYLQGSPLGENMQVENQANQSPQSFASSIYSLPDVANTCDLGEASNDCQPSLVPTPSCYADAWDISLSWASELGPPTSDLYAPALYTPEIDDSELLAAIFSETPLDAPPTSLPEPEDEVAKHKALFGRRDWLDRDRTQQSSAQRSSTRRSWNLKREPSPTLQHNYNLHFVTLTSLEAAIGNGQDKYGNPVSMGAHAQVVLYRELGQMLLEAINRFLVKQREEGRITQKSIDSVNAHWALKGFAAMPEFLWDLSHQRTLVGMNLGMLNFAGPGSDDPCHVQKVLSGWKILARDAGRNIRGLGDCMPDKKIRMHLKDARDLLLLVEVPEHLFAAFGQFRFHVKMLLSS